jgi:sugar/nucleoside kinase (ribokinase family)
MSFECGERMSLLVVGSVALDSVRTPRGEIREGLGGSATYFSVSAGLFTKVRLVAVVGRDFPRKHVRFLQSRGIDVQGLERASGKTFRWEGEYGKDLNEAKSLKTELNVFQDFRPELPEGYRGSRHVFLANIDPDLQERVLQQVEDPRLVACDTMNYWIASKPESLRRILRKVNVFLLNEGEAKQLAQEDNLLKAARSLLGFGPSIVVIKRGEYGALLFQGNMVCWAPAYPLESIQDPTGAGDSFAGGFMGYLSRRKAIGERELRRALVYGSIMASFCVEGFGLRRLGRVRRGDIAGRYQVFRSLTRF